MPNLPARFFAPVAIAVLSVMSGCAEGPAEAVDAGTQDTLRFTQIAAGARHTCALAADGQVWCWGNNAAGQLGSIHLGSAAEPVPVSSNARFATLATGAQHTCAITADGTAYCWGFGPWGVFPTPRVVGQGADLTSIASTSNHACGTTRDASVSCWGFGTAGQLGSGVSLAEGRASSPTLVPGLSGIGRVATGLEFSCALDSAGAAWCWGFNDAGELGSGMPVDECAVEGREATAPCALEPVRVAAEAPYMDLSAGLFHACGLLADGSIDCWGDGGAGQLGVNDGPGGTCDWSIGTVTDRACTRAPLRVSGSIRLASLARGSLHTCGVSANGDGYCWGENSFGQVGSGESQPGAGPELIAGGHEWAALSGGQVHTCGLTTSGAAFCWGDGTSGQLGSWREHSATPALVEVIF